MPVLSDDNIFGSGGGGYSVASSLLFRGAQYLTRTPGVAGNRKTFTLSMWVRHSDFSGSGGVKTLYAVTTAGGFNDRIQLRDNEKLWFISDSYGMDLRTTQVFRDPSGFYHLVFAVDTTQATASNRVKIYVNGTQITSFTTATYPAQNTDLGTNGLFPHYIGRTDGGSYMGDSLVEFASVDGMALTPSSFGELDVIGTMNWRPKAVSGITWGANGCYLGKRGWNFASLGTDSSGNGNTWTASGFASTDVLSDSPTNIYATLNPLRKGSTASLSSGSLTCTTTSSSSSGVAGTLKANNVDSVWEVTVVSGSFHRIGVCGANTSMEADSTGTVQNWVYQENGQKKTGTDGSGAASYGATYTAGDVIGVVLTASGTLTFYKNGVSQGTAFTGLTGDLFPFVHTSSTGTFVTSLNFGQRAFAYPNAYGTAKALCTSNLPAPSAAAKQPWKYYSQQLVVHNGTSSTFTVGWNPDPTNGGAHTLFLFKPISAGSWTYVDTVRGLTKALWGELTNAEGTYAGLVTAASTGVCTMGSPFTAGTYLVEAWKVDPASGFDIVTYSATGVVKVLNHNNGVKPSLIVTKYRSLAGTSWAVYHGSLGATKALLMDSTGAADTSSLYWNNTEPTATQFTAGTSSYTAGNTGTVVAYVWSEVPGFSKFTSWQGNSASSGNTDGPLAWLGFLPASVTVKAAIGGADHWQHGARAHSNDNNPVLRRLQLNASNAEAINLAWADFLAGSVKSRYADTAFAWSGFTHIIDAFAHRCMGGAGVSPSPAQ